MRIVNATATALVCVSQRERLNLLVILAYYFFFKVTNNEKNVAMVNNSILCHTPNGATTVPYNFDIEAVSKFFKSVTAKEFAKMIRTLNYKASLIWLENPQDVSPNLTVAMSYLNEFAEAIDPYFYNDEI